MKVISLSCKWCKRKFKRRAASHKSNLSRGRTSFFCSISCKQNWNSHNRNKPVALLCSFCGEKITRSQKDVRRSTSGLFFCNPSCANKHRQKDRYRICELCGGKIYRAKRGRKHCDNCKADVAESLLKIPSLTKRELFNSRGSWQSARSAIRKDASRVYDQSNKEKACIVCGYDKAVDIAHRKPVSKFSDDTRVSEINDISNLAALCKNHHWEFDHGTLELPC
jgi:YHS domain-containing protein